MFKDTLFEIVRTTNISLLVKCIKNTVMLQMQYSEFFYRYRFERCMIISSAHQIYVLRVNCFTNNTYYVLACNTGLSVTLFRWADRKLSRYWWWAICNSSVVIRWNCISRLKSSWWTSNINRIKGFKSNSDGHIGKSTTVYRYWYKVDYFIWIQRPNWVRWTKIICHQWNCKRYIPYTC